MHRVGGVSDRKFDEASRGHSKTQLDMARIIDSEPNPFDDAT